MRLTPLRYPGGKAQYIPLIQKYANQCKHSRYIEPFAGGAAVALYFAIKRHTPVLINDKDPAIHAFWWAVVNRAEEFIERIKETPITIGQWQQCRDVVFNEKKPDRFNLGFATFFLNRCNFSGCIQANPIGGIKQRGKWRINARFNKNNLINRIKLISENKDKIQVNNLDAVTLINSKIRKYDFIYLDPPYWIKSTKMLYKNYLKENGHHHLVDSLKKTSASWLMSYNNNSDIKELYKDYIIRQNKVRYSFLRKIKQNELLICSLGKNTII